jgi:uncharacterized protein (DUF2345 family)
VRSGRRIGGHTLSIRLRSQAGRIAVHSSARRVCGPAGAPQRAPRLEIKQRQRAKRSARRRCRRHASSRDGLLDTAAQAVKELET